MKRTATGRILFWQGGSLWIGLAGEPTDFHAHHAIQITLPFPRNCVRFRKPAECWTSYTAALVKADQSHAFEARAQMVALIFIDPESHDGRQLQERYCNEGIVALPSRLLDQQVAELAIAYEGGASDAVLTALARSASTVLSGVIPGSAKVPDARIVRALKLIRERLGDTIALTAIATAVYLSPDRFRHLFMQETGVSFRSYVLWMRLECSLAAYVAGQTLTEAAYIGGFADSAHFSRTFKRMFGITPASVRPE